MTSWKFPSIATVTFGIAFQIYTVTKCHLERRNRELEQTVESSVAQRELQEEELNRAREIQLALLPKEIPQIEGFEIAGIWEPARIVGGDYFDVIKLSEQRLGICIADVVGKRCACGVVHGECAGDGEGLCLRFGLTSLAVRAGQLGSVHQHRCGKIRDALLRNP